jgi:DNA-binding LacI/PurR family transcriptional regulator
MKPTLQEIARIAGVSSSTVSLVLANKGTISEEVQSKVRVVASKLGYRKEPPNQDGKTRKIAILFHFDHHLAHTWNMLRQVTLELQANLQKNNYMPLIIIPITYDMSDEEIFNRVMVAGAVAVFSMHFGRESLFSQLEAAAIPIVVIINSQFESKFHTVCADNFQGSCEAASHLLRLGHKNILYAEFNHYKLPATLSDRYLGFLKAMQEAGIDFPAKNRLHLDIDNVEDIKQQFEAAFVKNRPTAIFFIDDYLAARCVHILNDMGLSFPRDVSIIAAGEVLDYQEPFVPRITTMRTSPEQLGKFSAEMGYSILTGTLETNYVLKIKQQLVDRGSCQLLA